MNLIERYIFRRAFFIFATALAWTLAIVWTTQVLDQIDLVTTNGQSVLSFLELATLILPTVAPEVLPLAIVIGVTQTLTAMNTDSELAVIHAAGSSRLTIMRPLLLLGLGASLASFMIANTVDPYSRQRVRELVADARADLVTAIIQEGTFRKVEDGLYLQVGERRADGTLGEIFVADSRDPKIELTYYAKNGKIVRVADQNALLMENGVVHRKPQDGELSIIRFDTYAFDLSVFAPQDETVILYPKDRTIPYLMNPDPNDWHFQRNPQQFSAELHRRFAEWLYPLVFSLLAVAVAGDATSHRQARIHPILIALALALMIRWAAFFAANEARHDAAYVFVMYGLPLGVSGLCLYVILSNRTLAPPQSFTDAATALFERTSGRFNLLRRRMFGPSRTAEGGA
jgi:lipopolysaccharide export system permease protein